MILSTVQEGWHVDDGDLIRLRDGECPYPEERKLREHLDACSICRENAERIEFLASGFVAAVEEIKYPLSVQLLRQRTKRTPPKRRDTTPSIPWYGRRSVRVAAVLVTVCALALTTAPARALVAAGWQAIKTLFVGTPPAESQIQQTTSLVSFAPRGDEFLIDFVHTQSLGTLTVVMDTSASASASASARVLGGDGRDEMIVLQAGLRVRNRTVSSASYELRLPPFLKDIEVRVAGRTVAAFSTAGMTSAARWEVDLSNPGGR